MHHRVHHVAGQLEHPATWVSAQLAAQRPRGHLAHHPVNLHDFPKPTFAHRPVHELKRRIVAQHVAHLHCDTLALGQAEQHAKVAQRDATRLVMVYVQAGTHRAPGCRDQVRHLGLNGHRLQAGRCQQLLLRHLLHATIGAAAGNRRLDLLSRLRHPDQLKVTGELADRCQLARSVRVAAAELANPDPWLGSLGNERHRQRRAGGGLEE